MSDTRSNPHRYPSVWRVVLFATLTVVYGLYSSSTPDDFGVPEAIIAITLLAFIGLSGGLVAFGGSFLLHRPYLSKWVFVSFFGLLFIPLITGNYIEQNSLHNQIRDIVPLLYLFLPIFFIPKMSEHPTFWKIACITSLSFIAVSFSLRFFDSATTGIEQIGREIIFGGDDSYYPMDPSVLFGSTFLLTYGLLKLLRGNLIYAAVCLTLGAIAFSCLIAIIVRAQIGLVLISITLALFYAKSSRLTWIIYLAAFALIVLGLLKSDLSNMIWTLIEAKSESAGVLNSRDTEFAAVLNSAAASIWNLLFGVGWGGEIDALASGEKVRYTHNILLYFLLKGGVIGLAFGVTYCLSFLSVWASKHINFNSDVNLAISLGVINVLLLDLMIEPGFKMFSFGLVLTLLWLLPLEANTKINKMKKSTRSECPNKL